MRTSLADALFTQTQQRVLGLLFGQPRRSFYANELIRQAGIGSGAVQRELQRLCRSGLVTVRSVGHQKHFQANPDSPLFEELKSIASKSFALAEPLRAALGGMADQIRVAFVYGSTAKWKDSASSDIDLMVVADKLSYGDLVAALIETERALGRPINPTIFTSGEFMRRRRKRDSFVKRLLGQPKIWVIGTELELPT